MPASSSRMRVSVRSSSSLSSARSLRTTSCPTGIAEASYLKMVGGCIPGGRFCISALTSDATWLAGHVRIDLGPKVNADNPDPEQASAIRCGRDGRTRERALQNGDDALLHVRRGHSAIRREDDDNRRLQRRENVRWRTEITDHAQDRRRAASRPTRCTAGVATPTTIHILRTSTELWQQESDRPRWGRPETKTIVFANNTKPVGGDSLGQV